MAKLIPKIIPMSNTADLKDCVVDLLSQVLRRVKPLRIQLPCLEIIDQIIKPSMQPLTCNLGITFLDVGIRLENGLRRLECAKSVVSAIAAFKDEPFCSQMQALLAYALVLLDDLPIALSGSPREVTEIIGDFFVDVVLMRENVQKVREIDLTIYFIFY